MRHDGRANPNQLALGPHAEADLVSLRTHLVEEHARATGRTDGLVVGLQLTHSGRYARPNPGGRWEPITAYAHPVLDRRFPAGTPVRTFTDDELDALVDDFVRAAIVARAAGFDFVDVKHCHGYLGHELLSAWDRPGPYGGATGRTTFLRRIVEGIRRDAPGLAIGVRVSAFDAVPFRKDAARRRHAGSGHGVVPVRLRAARRSGRRARSRAGPRLPARARRPRHPLGVASAPAARTTTRTSSARRSSRRPTATCRRRIRWSACARQIAAVGALKRDFPNLRLVGTGYSYLQEWLPHVGQAAVREGLTDFVGLGRMVLSYPALPADVLAGKPLTRGAICRTFSDCTTARATAWSRAASRSTRSTRRIPDAARLKAIKEGTPA